MKKASIFAIQSDIRSKSNTETESGGSSSAGITELLRQEIARQGAIPFERFMELSLYAPRLGYYERPGTVVGRSGDFSTSVSSGALFGQLLGAQFRIWLESLPGERVWLIEAGAHDGRLALDLLGEWQASAPDLWERLGYLIVEPSAERRKWQARHLEEFAGIVQWCPDWNDVGVARRGVLFCNELLDAMPVRRLGWDNGRWFEWGVTVRDGSFAWARMELGAVDAEALFVGACVLPEAELLSVLPKDFTVDLCPAAGKWWRQAIGSLEMGWAVAIDYGLEAERLLEPWRASGTLRAYRRHRQLSDLLADPGEQDLTAHVNFTQIRSAGEEGGWMTERLVSQEAFLVGAAEKLWGLRGERRWTPSETRQFATLAHPDHMGRKFRVLVQSRSTGF